MDSNLQGYINDYLDFIKKQDNYMSFGIFIKDQNSQEILEDEINSIFEDEYQDYLYPNDDLEDDDLKDDFQLSIEFRILESIYDLFHSIFKIRMMIYYHSRIILLISVISFIIIILSLFI